MLIFLHFGPLESRMSTVNDFLFACKADNINLFKVKVTKVHYTRLYFSFLLLCFLSLFPFFLSPSGLSLSVLPIRPTSSKARYLKRF